MSGNFNDVGEFHRKFGLPVSEKGRPAALPPSEVLEFRTRFLEEELTEFKEAVANGSLEKAADALVDLVYVALGTAHMLNLPWEPLWQEVQRANMAKERATSAAQSKRGSTLDVIKPPGWQPPSFTSILEEHSQ